MACFEELYRSDRSDLETSRRTSSALWDPRPEVCGEHNANEPCAEQDAIVTAKVYGQLASGKLKVTEAGKRLDRHRTDQQQYCQSREKQEEVKEKPHASIITRLTELNDELRKKEGSHRDHKTYERIRSPVKHEFENFAPLRNRLTVARVKKWPSDLD